jgi:AmiR/NasT family two-component response regulator
MTNRMFTSHFLTTRIKTVLCAARRIYRELRHTSVRPVSVSDRSVSRIVAVTHDPRTKVAIRIAALHEGWQLTFVQSPKDAVELLGRIPVDIFVYDWESDERDWHKLCKVCVEHGVCFQLVANMATDNLFFSVISAGGLGVVCKPLTSECVILAMRFARSLSEAQLTAGAHGL